MSDTDTSVEVNAELEALKVKATEMSLSYKDTIGVAALQKKIDAAENNIAKAQKKETIPERNARLRKEAGRLVRVRVSCMNPLKRSWRGEIISVGSSLLGTYKKFIPFDIAEGYHIPYIMYDAMKQKEFQTFYTVKGKNGEPDVKRSKVAKEFNIELLKPLTEAELKELAEQQALNHSIE